jgi:O-antigen/teichoic acid export membrane protein
VVLAAALGAPFSILAALFLGPPLVSGAVMWVRGLKTGDIAVARRGEPGALRGLLQIGAPFLAVDLVTSLILRTPAAIVSRAQGLVEAGQFSAVQRLPFLLSAVLIVVLQPLWPFFTSAARAADRPAARVLVRRVLRSALLVWAVFAVLVLAFGRVLVRKWLGTDLALSAATLPLAVAFGLAQSLHYALSLALVGLGGRRENLVVSLCMLAGFVPACLLLTQSHGATGTFAALVLVFGVIGAPLSYLQVRRRMRLLQPSALGTARPG